MKTVNFTKNPRPTGGLFVIINIVHVKHMVFQTLSYLAANSVHFWPYYILAFRVFLVMSKHFMVIYVALITGKRKVARSVSFGL